MEAHTALAFFIPDGTACITIRITEGGLLKWEHSHTFRACFNAECLLNRLIELVNKIPMKILEALFDAGYGTFEIVAPPGVNADGKDISGLPIVHCPARPESTTEGVNP